MCIRDSYFFQAEDGIRDVERSRGLGDVYKRQEVFLDIGGQDIGNHILPELIVLLSGSFAHEVVG